MDSNPNPNPNPDPDPGGSSNTSKFRKLLPSLVSKVTRGSSAAAPSSSRIDLPPRRSAVTSACSSCRKRKAKCGGQRPKCQGCLTRKIDCHYDAEAEETLSQAAKRKYTELQDRVSAHQRVFSAMQARPQADADAILKRIRRGDDIDTIARHVDYGDLLLQVSLHPETRYRYVFPLLTDMPAHLVRSRSPYLHSMLYEWTVGKSDDGDSSGASPAPPASSQSAPNDVYMKPYHAADVIDAQLSRASPSKWTSVSKDDELLRRLLSNYFLQEYGSLTAFQKEYFLEDMIEERRQLCSSLLVNATLALSCFYDPGLSNRAEFWDPQSLSYQFLAETRRLWDSEIGKDKLTTIQTGVLMNIIYNICGLDKVGWVYMAQAIAMGHNLGLFYGTPPFRSQRMKDAATFTAWVTFNWQSLMQFQYFRAPILERPPAVAQPNPATNPSFYGEIWLKYPLTNTLFPARFGDVWKAKSDLMVLMNDAASYMFGDPPRRSPPDLISLVVRLQQWFRNLPETLQPRRIALPIQLRLHLWYMLTLVRILDNSEMVKKGGTYEYTSDAGTEFIDPRQVLQETKDSFETLIRIYYLRHGFERLDICANGFFLTQSNLSLTDIATDPDSPDTLAKRMTLVLIAKSMYDQGRSAFMARVLYQMMRDAMSPEDGAAMDRFAGGELTWKNHLRPGEVRSDFPNHTVNKAQDPNAKRMNELIQKYKEEEGGLSGDESATP